MPELPKISTVAILFHIAGHDTIDNYGLAISKATGYPSGTVVPALKRLSERDGFLVRSEVPTKTGKPRATHSLTDEGKRFVSKLLEDIEPRIRTLAGETAEGVNQNAKVNLSTIWILAAALGSDGRINGYDDRLRPLTHQAAYVELDRLVAEGWFDEGDQGKVLTPSGREAANAIGQSWLPVIEDARRNA